MDVSSRARSTTLNHCGLFSPALRRLASFSASTKRWHLRDITSRQIHGRFVGVRIRLLSPRVRCGPKVFRLFVESITPCAKWSVAWYNFDKLSTVVKHGLLIRGVPGKLKNLSSKWNKICARYNSSSNNFAKK